MSARQFDVTMRMSKRRVMRVSNCVSERGLRVIFSTSSGLTAEASASETIAGSSISACPVACHGSLGVDDRHLQRTTICSGSNPLLPLPAVFSATIVSPVAQKLMFAMAGRGSHSAFCQLIPHLVDNCNAVLVVVMSVEWLFKMANGAAGQGRLK